MAQPVYQSQTQVTFTGTTTGAMANPPGSTDGDVLIAVIVTDGNTSPAPVPVADWTLISTGNSSGEVSVAAWRKTFNTGEGSTTFNWTGSERGVATIMRISNTSENTVLVTPRNGSSTNPIADPVNTTLANSLVLKIAGVDRETVSITNPNLTSITTTASGGGGNGIGQAIGYRVEGPGPSSSYTFTANNEQWRTLSISLRPPLPAVAFRITHGGSGTTCSPTDVTFTAVDINGDPVPTFTGAVTVTAPNGDWSVVSAANPGSFTNDNPGNGDFTYTFTTGDAGDITLAYAPTVAGSLDINITDGSITENSHAQGVDQQLTVSLCGFTIFHDGVHGTCAAAGYEEILITAVEPDGSTLRSGYTGTITIKSNATGENWNTTAVVGEAEGMFNQLPSGDLEYTFAPADNGQVTLRFFDSNPETVNFDIFDNVEPSVDALLGTDLELVVSGCGFTISHDGNAGTCGYELITLASTVSGNSQTITITTPSSTVGVWIPETGDGTFTSQPDGNFQYSFDGSLDTATFRFYHPVAATVTFDIEDDMANDVQVGADNPLEITDCEFLFTAPATGENCSANNITLSVVDGFGNAVNGYTGTVTLTTDSGIGVWGQGTATNAPDDSPTVGDGQASLTFAAADNGSVDITLSHDDPGMVQINASESVFGIPTPSPPTINILACSFWVSFTGPGDTCTPTNVTIEARNAAGSLISNYAGTVTITTTTGNGDWTLGGATSTATFTNQGSGSAQYAFSPSDGGSVTLAFRDNIVETTNFNVTDGLLVVDSGHDPDLDVQPCKFLISHAGSADVCSPAAITFTLVDHNDAPVTDYTGQIFISTSASGSWTDGTTSGIVDTGGGSASYQFVAGDMGTATFNFQGDLIALYDIDVTDGSNTDNDGDPTDDPDIDFTACNPTITSYSCVNANSTSVTIPGGAESLNTRAVVMVTGYEGTAAITGTAFNGTPATGNVVSRTNTGNPANTRTYTEMYAWLDTDLPAAGGTYTGAFTVDNGQAMCLIALKNVDQNLPVVPAVASSEGNAGGTISTSLTSPSDNAIVISGVSANDPGGFNTNTLGNQVGNFDVGGDWSFSVGSGTVGTGTVTVTESKIGALDRYTHIIAAFATAPAPLSYFKVTHDGVSTACTMQEVTITARDINGNIKTDYGGTVTLTTSVNHGNWFINTGNGVLTDTANDDNGIATYQFAAADNGSVTLTFIDPHVETLDFAVADGSITDDGSHGILTVNSCEPVIGNTQCYASNSGTVDIVGRDTSSARAVIMSIAIEGNTGLAVSPVPTFDSQNMSLVTTADASDGSNSNRAEMYVILDANLPAAAGTYTGSFTDPGGNLAMCLTAVYGIEQAVPVYPAVASNTISVTATSSTATVTTTGNNALVMSIATDDRNNGTYSSTLNTTLWNNETPPKNAVFSGFAGYQAQAGPKSDTVTPSSATNRLAHIMASFSPVVAGPPTADDFVPLYLYKTFSGAVNYRAYGSTYRTLPNGNNVDACTYVSPSTGTTINVAVPTGSAILGAYLYWSGSGDDALGQTDTDVTLVDPAMNSYALSADDTFLIQNVGGGNNLDYFAGFKDVSTIVTSNGAYTLQDLNAQSGAPWQTTSACEAGWALVVVYENSLEEVQVINLFHGFQPFQNNSFVLVPRNFRMKALDIAQNLPHGQLTYVTFEGDEDISSAEEKLGLQDAPGSGTFNYLTNSFNPAGGQYNGTVTRPIYDGSLNWLPTAGPNMDGYEIDVPGTGGRLGDSFGIDVDTHFLAGSVMGDPLYQFGIAPTRPEQITTQYSAGQDLVLLVAGVVTVTNEAIADLETTLTEGPTFVVGGTSTYTISTVNNGDGAGPDGSMTGSATVTVTLPQGLSINTITAPGWVCVGNNTPTMTVLGLPAFACEYDISSPLAEGGSLPDIDVEVAIGDATVFPNLVNQANVVVRTLYHGGNCAPDPLDDTSAAFGTSPDPGDCTISPEFDNIMDLEGGALSMNDLVEKSARNNNIDSRTTTINGRKTDLQLTKVAGVLQESTAGTYTITVTNLGPQAATRQITVTDTLPAGLTYLGFLETGDDDGWSCGAVGQTVTCTTDVNLAPGDNANFLMGVQLSSPAIENATVNNTACVSIASGNFDTVTANNCDTESSTVQGEPVAGQNKFLISVNLDGTSLGSSTGTLTFNMDDVILYDPASDVATMFFDDSADNGGLAGDINALHIRKNGHMIVSPAADSGSIAGVGYDQGDLLVYDPILGSATLLFDGSAVFNSASTNIDAVFEQDDGTLVISTTDAAGIGGVTWDKGDWVSFDPASPGSTVTVLLDGNDSAVFNADVQLNGTYFKVGGSPSYVITIGQGTANIATGNTTVTGDDIASLQPGVDSRLEFRGSVPNGVFSPLLSSRYIDGVHLVEDSYFGHFSITENVSGNTCTPTTVIISKHDLNHNIDTSYTGSIRIDMDYMGTATWSIIDGDGTLTHTTGNQYIYTFVPTDNGEVTLSLTVPDDGASVNVDVSNGLRHEASSEDPTFTFNDIITVVSYGDNFATNDYAGSSGTSGWNGSWVEVDPDPGNTGAGDGNVYVSGGEVYFDNRPGSVDNSSGSFDNSMPAITRTVDFSLYALANTLTLTFDWRTVSVNTGDSFTVEVKGDTTSGNPWLEVATFTGFSGTNSGSESYDLSTILAGAGQMVSANTGIRFRVEDNYDVSGNFILDNVVLTTGTADCGVGSVHHYDIIHAGSGVMCEAYPITFVAHDVAHTEVAPGLGTVVNLSTSSGLGSWSAVAPYNNLADTTLGDGLASYTFGLGETRFTANFNLTAPNVNTASTTINFNIAQGALTEQNASVPVDPDFLFLQAGFIYVDNFLSSNKILGPQIAGKFSSTAPSNPIVIRAVRTSDDALSCQALFQNQTVTVQMGAECKNPAACLAGTVNVIDSTATSQPLFTSSDNGDPNSVAADVPVTLAFNGDGEAELEVMYDDAGSIQLYTEYDIRLDNDPSGLQSGDVMWGASNPFVVRPFGFNIDMSANGTQTISVDENGTAFKKAGEPFSVNIQAVTWEAADDLDQDGVPDANANLATGNAVTPNFGNESLTPTVTLTHSVVSPLTSTAGALLGTTSFGGFSGGQENHTDIAFSEVGIIDLAANLSGGDYLGSGENIEGHFHNLGRFTPDHYAITGSAHINRAAFDMICTPESSFTYMGEPLQLTIDIQAENAAGDPTRNYYAGFEKLTAALGSLDFSAVDLDSLDVLTGRLDASGMTSFTWENDFGSGLTGEGVISGTLILDKGASPDGPFDMFTVGFIPTDDDGITLLPADYDLDLPPLGSSDTVSVMTTKMRYGRLSINSTGGSEISTSAVPGEGQDIPVTLVIEYYDDGTMNFLINGLDDCSTFSSDNLSVVSDSYTNGLAFDGLGPATPSVGVNVGVTTGTVTVLNAGSSSTGSSSGDVPFYISAPYQSDAATTDTGTILIELDLDTAVDIDPGPGTQNEVYDYLKFDWRDEGSSNPYDENPAGGEDNPRAIIDFGTFQGHNRVINWQEILRTN